jgi:hypothetical protein
MFFCGIGIALALGADVIPERAGALAAALIAASFGLMCLGATRHWFTDYPLTFPDHLRGWLAALFFDTYLVLTTFAALYGLARLIHWK